MRGRPGASTYTRWVKAVLWLSAVLLAVWYVLSLLPIGDFVYRIFIWISVPVVLLTVARELWPNRLQRFKSKRRRAIALLVATVKVLALICVVSVCTVLVSSYFSCWCCVTKYHKEALCKTMGLVAGTFEEHQISYFACYGTVLMALRDADTAYQSVPWEHDVDLCVHHGEYQKVVDAISATPGIQVDWAHALHDQFVVVPEPYPTRLRWGRSCVDIRWYTGNILRYRNC